MKPLRSNISDKELDFVERRLDGRVLPSLLENVKVAIRNDNLMTPKDQKFLEEVTQISDFDEFKTRRRAAVDAYNEICDRIVDELKDFEKISEPELRVKEMTPMFKDIIEKDARRRGFDMVYGEDENISEYLTEDLEDLVNSSVEEMSRHDVVSPGKKDEVVEEYVADLMVPTTPSFEKRTLTTFLTFLKKADERTHKIIVPEDRERLTDYLSDNFESIDENTNGVLSVLFESTSRQHLPTLSQKLKSYSEFVGSAEEELEELQATSRRKEKRKMETLESTSSFLPENDCYELYRKVDQIDQVHSFIYEDVSRHSNFRAVNDYFFRELIAETLYELDEIDSEYFWEHSQQKLLDITEEYSKNEHIPT